MFFKPFRKPKPLTDADALSAYKATGDLELLGALFERYMDLIYAVCYKYLRDEEESKDAVMQLFEQLITDLRKYEIQNFKSWLHSTARNYCLMQLRQRKMIAGEVSDEAEIVALPLTVWPETDGLDLETKLNHLDDCLKTLSDEQRTSISLFYLNQKTYADIAELTGYDPKHVKSHLQNGRRNLKICMDKRHD
ncbi:sigma-70 family RNA polymerase sigma factor [Larkinella knui]|uniref:Sigma-70 family RNA polymerase sigma factor n=1 Tax=Larkinella knui TaxID=2025310 RepID=A0A3P1CBJ1_9BACT|nr:sigma-70 family RNA polymerase sigma factor [Larkinella knui]RRB10618.1 sigma-70 family RNA polymerase sigma factor [Larkinella knui]